MFPRISEQLKCDVTLNPIFSGIMPEQPLQFYEVPSSRAKVPNYNSSSGEYQPMTSKREASLNKPFEMQSTLMYQTSDRFSTLSNVPLDRSSVYVVSNQPLDKNSAYGSSNKSSDRNSRQTLLNQPQERNSAYNVGKKTEEKKRTLEQPDFSQGFI